MADLHKFTGDEVIATELPELLNQNFDYVIENSLKSVNGVTKDENNNVDVTFLTSQVIPTNSDLNTFGESGEYIRELDTIVVTNSPTEKPFFLTVLASENLVKQVVTEIDSEHPQTYTRTLSGANWSAWVGGGDETIVGNKTFSGTSVFTNAATFQGMVMLAPNAGSLWLDVSNSIWFMRTTPNNRMGYLSAQEYTGNAASASQLATARTITLSGDVAGSVSFNGSADVTIETTYTGSGGSAVATEYVDITSGVLTVSDANGSFRYADLQTISQTRGIDLSAVKFIEVGLCYADSSGFPLTSFSAKFYSTLPSSYDEMMTTAPILKESCFATQMILSTPSITIPMVSVPYLIIEDALSDMGNTLTDFYVKLFI